MRRLIARNTFNGLAIFVALASSASGQETVSTSSRGAQQFLNYAFSDSYVLGEAEGAWVMTVGFARSCMGPHCPTLTQTKLDVAHSVYSKEIVSRAAPYRLVAAQSYQSRLSDNDFEGIKKLLENPVYNKFEAAKAEVIDDQFWGKVPNGLSDALAKHRAAPNADAIEAVHVAFPGASQEGILELTPYYESQFSEGELHQLAEILKDPEYKKFSDVRDTALNEKPFKPEIIESLKAALPVLTGESKQ